MNQKIESIVVYTAAPWEMALVAVRLTGPASCAGVRVLQGKHGDRISPELVHSADLVVIQRDFPRYWDAYLQIIELARIERKAVIFEIDDLLFDMPLDHSHVHEYADIQLSMLHAALNADLVTVSTSELELYMRRITPNVSVIPNFLDDRIWNINPPIENFRAEDTVLIGYMGGETHQLDLELIAPVLIQTLDRYAGKVRLIIWGGKPPEDLLRHPAVEWIPINELNYGKFVEFFARRSCDLFISPLRDNPFNRAKSGLKFLEYSVHAVPGIYSRMPPYENIVVHGENGYLADSLDEWEDCLAQLIDDPNLCRRMGIEAQKTIKENWLLTQNTSQWVAAYKRAIQISEETKDQRGPEPFVQILEQGERYQRRIVDYNTALSKQIDEIFQSRSWEFIQRIQSLRLKLLPKGGRGERILQSVLDRKVRKSNL